MSFFLLIVSTFALAQQDSIYISFTGNKPISALKVTNLDSVSGHAGTIMLYGNNEKLLLLGDSLYITGIKSLNATAGLSIYPNPLTSQSILSFMAPENGTISINIIDALGKLICQTTTSVSTGKYCFRITDVRTGMYLVQVKGQGFNYAATLLSTGENNEPKISYVSYSPVTSRLKESYAVEDTTIKTLNYKKGDILKYRATSTTSDKAVLTDSPTTSKTVAFNFVQCQDRDGRNYATLTIVKHSSKSKSPSDTTSNDTIIWMAENINVGTQITAPTTQTGYTKYCYNNVASNCDVYGGLYVWGEALQFDTTGNTDTVQGICPSGWRVSCDHDWEVFMKWQGGDTIDIDSIPFFGGYMKESGLAHWAYPNAGATDSLGFTGLPSGGWNGGFFSNIYNDAVFWTSTRTSLAGNALSYDLNNYSATVFRGASPKIYAISVRCVHN